MTTLNLSRMHFPVTTLGPGKRIGIWFQGCSLQCPGCVSVDTWKAGKGSTTLQSVFDQVDHWAAEADGITISGGEPFEQEAALVLLLRYLKEHHSQLTTLVYSGYSFTALRDVLKRMEGLIDVLISEPFVQAQPSKHPWTGSSNQKMHFLNEGVRSEFSLLERNQNHIQVNEVDAMFDGEQLWMAGILKPDALEELSAYLAKQGHKINHTQRLGQTKQRK